MTSRVLEAATSEATPSEVKPPSTMVTLTAPTEAPAETPRMNGSASTLRTTAWITAPLEARAAPTTAAMSARGALICHTIW